MSVIDVSTEQKALLWIANGSPMKFVGYTKGFFFHGHGAAVLLTIRCLRELLDLIYHITVKSCNRYKS